MNVKRFIKGILFITITLMGMNEAKAQISYPAKAEDISPLLIGEKIPKAILADASGNSFDLHQAIAQKPTLLIFYRGGWCPYCSVQLSGLQQIDKELESIGYQVIAISTDKPENLKNSMEKEKLSYRLLSDADLTLAKQIGIAFKAPDNYHKFLSETTGGKNKDMLLPVPSVFILNKEGEIRFEYIEPNFKERISPEFLKAAAMALFKDL